MPTLGYDRAHQRTDAEADPEQIEQRLEETGDDHHPVAPVEDRVALDEARCPVGGRLLGPRSRGEQANHRASSCRYVTSAAAKQSAAMAARPATRPMAVVATTLP